MEKNKSIRQRFILVFILGFLFVLVLLPLIVVFLLSIVPRWNTAFPTQFSLEWWIKILNVKFGKIFMNTILLAIVSTLLTVIYGIIAAYLFVYYEFRGKKLLSSLIFSPSYIPGMVIALGLLMTYPLLRNTFWILVFGHFIIVTPTVFNYIYSSMKNIPDSLIDMSYNLGASQLQTIFKIILPLCKHGILAGTILSIGMNISELSVSLLLFGPNWVTVPVRIYIERGWGTLGVAGVLSTILIITAIVIMYSVNRLAPKKL